MNSSSHSKWKKGHIHSDSLYVTQSYCEGDVYFSNVFLFHKSTHSFIESYVRSFIHRPFVRAIAITHALIQTRAPTHAHNMNLIINTSSKTSFSTDCYYYINATSILYWGVLYAYKHADICVSSYAAQVNNSHKKKFHANWFIASLKIEYWTETKGCCGFESTEHFDWVHYTHMNMNVNLQIECIPQAFRSYNHNRLFTENHHSFQRHFVILW